MAVKKAQSAAGKRRSPGRPRAKHSSPDYTQMSIYIHRQVRNLTKVELFKLDGEFSALVESLLRKWLVKRGVEVPEFPEPKLPR